MPGRARRRSSAVSVLVAAGALALPIAAGAAPAPDPSGTRGGADQTRYADPSRTLGATSPSCRYAVDEPTRRRCRASGSAAQDRPLSAYGIDVRAGFSLTDPGRTFMGALGSLGAGVWTALLYVVKGVLLLLEWTFSLELTNQAMPEARRSLDRLHDRAFGDGWLLLAISIAALWGMWRGLVQRRATETLVGLAATIALIVAGLVVISRPGETVGRAAQLTNDAGMSILAAATTGEVGRPRQALTSALAQTFETTVRDPWCALQFGSVDYCHQPTEGGGARTNADLWLSYPAQGWERGRLHELMRGDEDEGFSVVGEAKDLLGLGEDRELPEDVERLVAKSPEHAEMQQAGGTFPRLALLATVTVGLLGAVALYAYLGLRLLLAAGLTLVLLLLAPAMLLAPAVGDSGRATFIAWAMRLTGALLAKLIYAVFLAAVLAASRVFTQLEIGWFGTWLLLAAFWWGVFLKRNEIVGFVSAGTPRVEGRGVGDAISTGYHAWMLGRGLRQVAGRTLRPASTAASAVRSNAAEARTARDLATQDIARERLNDGGRRTLAADESSARQTVTQRGRLEQELGAVNRALRGRDEVVATANAARTSPPPASSREQQLIAHREQLQSLLAAPAAREAEQTVRHADRNRALTGEAVTGRDLDVYRARRAADLRAGLPDDDPRHLRAAGVAPDHYAGAPPDEREHMLDAVRGHLAEERVLLEVADGRVPVGDGRRHLEHLASPEEIRSRTAERRAQLRAERRHRRLTDGAYRR